MTQRKLSLRLDLYLMEGENARQLEDRIHRAIEHVIGRRIATAQARVTPTPYAEAAVNPGDYTPVGG
jgi:hypothetical protein